MNQNSHANQARWSSYADFYNNSAYSEFAQEYRTSGSFGISQIQVSQPAVDMIDPVVPEYVIARVDTSSVEASIDLGDGARRSIANSIGNFVITPPDTEARFQVFADHDLSIVTIPSNAVERLLDESGLTAAHPFSSFYGNLRPAPEAAPLIDTMWQASAQGGPAANLLLDGLTLQLLSVLTDDTTLSPVAGAAREDVKIKRAIEYIESYLDTTLSINELAEIASMSDVHFAQAFKATTGQAVWAYVQMRRRESVESLLQAGTKMTSRSSTCGVGDRRLARTVDYIEAHLGTALTVGELASVAAMSQSALARAFRAVYGESVWSYVQGRRTARALEMLKQDSQPIAQVAELCGFASQSHLTSAMRSRLGVTPGAVRGG